MLRIGLSLLLAALAAPAGFALLGSAPLTIPTFHDGQAAPKTIAVVIAHAHRVSPSLVSVR